MAEGDITKFKSLFIRFATKTVADEFILYRSTPQCAYPVMQRSKVNVQQVRSHARRAAGCLAGGPSGRRRPLCTHTHTRAVAPLTPAGAAHGV